MEKEKTVVNFENLKNVYNIFLYKIKESADLTSQEKCEKREQEDDEVRNEDGTTKWRNNDVNEKESENSQKTNDNKIVNSMHGKETTCNECTDECIESTILFSYVGKKLFLSNNLNVKKDENIRNYIIVKKDNSLWMIFNKRKNLYAVVILPNAKKDNNKDKQKKNTKKNDIKNKYSYIYSVYTYCKIRYNSDLRYFIKINFLKSTFKVLKICTINFNEHLLLLLLNYTSLQKDDIKDKFKFFNNSNILYFVIVSIFERKNDQALVDTAMSVLKKGKKKSSIFHIIKNKSYYNSLKLFNYKHVSSQNKFYTNYFSNNDGSDLSKQKESLYNEERRKTNDNILLVRQRNEFFQNILSIFSLLNIENKHLLNFYNLENHTRIFIYNCEKLNRNIFINFLKSFQNFYIHFVNLNTLFGLYFSETERNIVNVFEKCHRVLRRASKNVCLVIDGIDIMAKNDTKNVKENINSSIIDEANRNCNSRLLATLLLCLDSVDNDTSNKYKTTNQNSFEASSDDSTINPQKNQQNCKEGKKKNIPMHNDQDDPSFSFSEFSDNNDCSDNTEKEKEKNKKGKKKKKLSEHIYFDIKKLEKIYKEKHEELIKKKKNNNLSVIVISDMDLTNFDTSLTRAGRFFHYINYRSFC
ncbi:conserved Plasmodium protein, unknown function [Plasmodium vinckei lentum]|uniref:ATPase AAA-type core domain-containing protein n=1 Tax=Plasmodium vinckei lentum TaxID=138297 RepID=A0A6V7RVS3_PLAVN|nr:conserved Plasmodium protein, unknown function [Plasmodium vinckei lentum]